MWACVLPLLLLWPWAFTPLLGVGVPPVWEEGKEAKGSPAFRAKSGLLDSVFQSRRMDSPEAGGIEGVTSMPPPQVERWTGLLGQCC